MQFRYWILLILAGLPLALYPFIFLANIMSMAGHPSPDPTPLVLRLTANAFLWSSMLYPVVYIGCVVLAIALSAAGSTSTAEKMSLLPLLYLALVVAFFCGWMMTSQ
jgi:hypothetical protein